MAYPRTKRKKVYRRGGGNTSLQAGTGLPPSYPLPFYGSSYLGTPLYHFRGDWESAAGSNNFTNFSGQEAKPGDQVKTWKNAYLGAGEGDAFVPLDYTTTSVSVQTIPPHWSTPHHQYTDNYFHSQNFRQGYPILVERGDYCLPGEQGQHYRGLKFTGTEYLQITGSTVKDAYADGIFNTSPLFTTNGTSLMSGAYQNSGASFLFVIDQDVVEDNNPGANGLQALLYSRVPSVYQVGHCPIAWTPDGYCWPSTENMGIQYMRNGSTYGFSTNFTKQRWGPEQAHPSSGGLNLLAGHNPSFDPPPAAGGSFYGLWNSGSNPAPNYEKTKPGFQIILLEFDTLDTMNYRAGGSADVNCLGPTVKLYAISAPVGGPWDDSGSNNFTTPKLVGKSPSLQFQTLFDRANLFLGGTPPYLGSNISVGNRYGNGFRGILYEFMMFEGKLSDADKQQLETIFTAKYRGALEGLPC